MSEGEGRGGGGLGVCSLAPPRPCAVLHGVLPAAGGEQGFPKINNVWTRDALKADSLLVKCFRGYVICKIPQRPDVIS